MRLLEAFKSLPSTHITLLIVMLVLFAAFGFKPSIRQMWNDSTKYDNGRYAVLRLTKAVLFLFGVLYVGTAYVIEVLHVLDRTSKTMDAGNGFALIGLGIGAQVVKEGADKLGGLLDRKTRDSDGPLAVPPDQVPPGEVPPPMMPQE